MKERPKILIIEDQEVNHMLYDEAFSFSGFNVIIKKSADTGFLDLVAELQPAVIAMDFMIKETDTHEQIDGLDVLAKLKTDVRTNHIPVIMLTNFISDEKIASAKELGAIDYIFVQGQQLKKIADHFMWYVLEPKKFIPMQPSFRTES